MRWKKNMYFVHRWLALLVSLQLLAWSVGGFMFSILDIDNVHGDRDRNVTPPSDVNTARIRINPDTAMKVANESVKGKSPITTIRIREQMDRVVYEMFDSDGNAVLVVDAESGDVASPISEGDAEKIALSDFKHDATVASVKLIEDDVPLEYRGKPLPAYQIILNHPKEPHIYVSVITGEVLTRRNKPWRIFDFFWMLHIMDYGKREDFNHWLLTCMSAIAILTSGTGLLLWTFRVKWTRKVRPGDEVL